MLTLVCGLVNVVCCLLAIVLVVVWLLDLWCWAGHFGWLTLVDLGLFNCCYRFWVGCFCISACFLLVFVLDACCSVWGLCAAVCYVVFVLNLCLTL